jgi:hypothetical protein
MTATANQRRSPYPGLVPFDIEDAPYYFGRETEARLLVARLFASPFTLLYGRSGMGKTSLLRAGVMKRLADDQDALAVWFAAWQGHGNDARNLLRRAVSGSGDGKATHRVTLPDAIRRLADRSGGRHVMILLDQFEDFFLYHEPGHELESELAAAMNLSRSTNGSPLRMGFLVSMREDALAGLARFKRTVPGLFRNQIRLEDLQHDRAVKAIEEPLRAFRDRHHLPVRCEPGLAEEVLKDIEKSPHEPSAWWFEQISEKGRIHTPHLQLVMDRIWEEERKKQSDVLHVKTFRNQGGSSGIVARHVNQQLEQLSPADQDVASQAFRFLVTPSGSKWALSAEDLEKFTGYTAKDLRGVLERLVGAKWLLRRIAPPEHHRGRVRYELVHDVLAGAVVEWRERRLAGLLERWQSERAGNFEELATLHARYERERAQGRVTEETKARYETEFAAFEHKEGRIIEAFWGTSGRAIALTEKPPHPLNRAIGRESTVTLGHAGLATVGDPDVADVLRSSNALATQATMSLEGKRARHVLHEVLALQARVLSSIEGPSHPSAALKRARAELPRVEGEFRTAATLTERTAYLRGVASSFAAVVLLGAIGTILVTGRIGASVALAAVGGALAASASVLARLGRPSREPALPPACLGPGPLGLLGAVRPMLGTLLAVLAYWLLTSGVRPLADVDPFLIAAVASVAGLGERLAEDVVVSGALRTSVSQSDAAIDHPARHPKAHPARHPKAVGEEAGDENEA